MQLLFSFGQFICDGEFWILEMMLLPHSLRPGRLFYPEGFHILGYFPSFILFRTHILWWQSQWGHVGPTGCFPSIVPTKIGGAGDGFVLNLKTIWEEGMRKVLVKSWTIFYNPRLVFCLFVAVVITCIARWNINTDDLHFSRVTMPPNILLCVWWHHLIFWATSLVQRRSGISTLRTSSWQRWSRRWTTPLTRGGCICLKTPFPLINPNHWSFTVPGERTFTCRHSVQEKGLIISLLPTYLTQMALKEQTLLISRRHYFRPRDGQS